MRPVVVVVAHTHWDREWYQPLAVFRLRLAEMVTALVDILDRHPDFTFMLDGQTIAVDDVLEVAPSLRQRLTAHLAGGRVTIGPWYVLQDEFLVGGESIVRNLAEGIRGARRFGRAMPVGYLPDAFGHVAGMPRILRGFGIDTAVVWRGVGEHFPGSEWRWRSPDGAEVLCLFLPGGYGNAHALGSDVGRAADKLRHDLAAALPSSRARVMLWMNGNDHQPAEPTLPSLVAELRAQFPDVDVELASLERAADLVRARVDVASLPVVDGELRRATPSVPVLSGTWSSRTWQKRKHDEAQSLLARFVEPFVAFAGIPRREPVAHAWRQLLQCQPHDSICGCSVDEVHRDVDARLDGVLQAGRALFANAVQSIVASGAATPAADFALHDAVAVANPHPFTVDGVAEVDVQRLVATPFRLVGPHGDVVYDIVSRFATDGPGLRPAEWLRLRIVARALPPCGVQILALEPGTATPLPPVPSPLHVRPVDGGVEIVDGERVITHTFEDEGDRGDLYDFCPRDDFPPRSSRDADLGVTFATRIIGRRVEFDVTVDNRIPDRRLRARFSPASSLVTDSAFGWIARAGGGTHPVSSIAATEHFAVGGDGLHEVELRDGALYLTLFRGVGWMSRGDLSTRPGHAGYNVPTPDAQGLGILRYRYAIAVGDDAVANVQAGIVPPRAVALERGHAAERSFCAVTPSSARVSIIKRAEDGDELVIRLAGPPRQSITARVTLARPIAAAFSSDLDERIGAPLIVDGVDGNVVEVPIAADDVVTLRVRC